MLQYFLIRLRAGEYRGVATANAAIDEVVTAAADNPVVAIPTEDYVVVGTAIERVCFVVTLDVVASGVAVPVKRRV